MRVLETLAMEQVWYVLHSKHVFVREKADAGADSTGIGSRLLKIVLSLTPMAFAAL